MPRPTAPVAADGKPAYRPFGTLRTALALLVLLSHAVEVSPIGQYAPEGLRYGPIAVFVFFALSGFVITEAALAFYRGRAGSFLANRIVRLYPPYAFALVVAIVLLLCSGGPFLDPAWRQWRNVIANFLAIFPSVPLTDRLLGVHQRVDIVSIIWAVRIEFAFYLVVAAALAWDRLARGRSRRIVNAQSVGWLVLALHVLTFYGTPGDGRLAFYLQFAPHFVVGVAAAMRENGAPRAMSWLAGAALLLATAQAVAYPDPSGLAAVHQWAADSRHLSPIILYLALMLVFWRLGVARGGSPRWLRLDRRFGEYSYPIYLLQIPALYFVQWTMMARHGSPHPLNLLLMVVPTVVLAWVVVTASERLLDPLRRRLRRHALPSS